MNNSIEKLLKNPLSFLNAADNSNDIVAISSRIRLARNLQEFAFPVAAKLEELQEVRNQVDDLFAGGKISKSGFYRFFMDELPELDRKILFERRLISNDLLENVANRAVYISANEKISLMVNEEDHLRIQSFCNGFNLKKAYKAAENLDNKISEHLQYAFDPRLGYLSSCPSNVGTAVRASVMLHLVGLQISGELDSAVRALNKLNFAVRGVFGEGSSNVGSLFQISNQFTLGCAEEEILEKIQNTIEQIISYELNAREQLFRTKQYEILDYIGRSYGMLKHAYLLENKELYNAISGVKLGVDMGVFSNLNIKRVHEIFISMGDAHLQKYHGAPFKNIEEKNSYRAALVRDKIRKGQLE
ncbi:MAG: ATP--guanido phosphotransferase [Lentisphaeria bacterium]|nr:ATP--guanido phosphotransferase [Lentisphaeria bacterium]